VEISRPVRLHPENFGYVLGDPRRTCRSATADSAAFTPKSVVADPAFSWGDDHRPRRRWNRTVVYECHVKGMTARHPAVPPEHRGTFLGLASEPVIDHLLELGVTAVELMPVQQAASGAHLANTGLTEYWGYNTIAFFAPDIGFAAVVDARSAASATARSPRGVV